MSIKSILTNMIECASDSDLDLIAGAITAQVEQDTHKRLDLLWCQIEPTRVCICSRDNCREQATVILFGDSLCKKHLAETLEPIRSEVLEALKGESV